MYPRLFELPWVHWPINSYGFMIMIGFLLATYVAVRRAAGINVKSDLILDIGIISMIFGIIGAKINFILQYPENYQDAYRIFDLGDGGMNVIGGLILGPIPLAFWWMRTKDEEKIKLYAWQNFVLLGTTVVCAIVGARALHLYLAPKGEYDWKLITGWQSGFVLYGGLIAGLGAGALYTKMRGQSILQLGDIAAPVMMLGLAFGRVGCLLNGCCYGKPTTLPWGLKFPEGSEAAWSVLTDQRAMNPEASESLLKAAPVHPTMIYESLAALAIFFFLSWYWKKKKTFHGEVFLLLGVCYPLWRFIVEFWRGDKRPTWLGPLSYSQTLGLGIMIACAVGWFLLKTRPKEPEAKSGLASQDTTKKTEPAPAK